MSRPLLTVADVAARLRTKPAAVSALCREGKLRAIKPMKSWLITEEDYEEFLAAARENTNTVKGAA